MPAEDSNIPVSLSDALLFLEWGQMSENIPTGKDAKLGPLAAPDSYATSPKLEEGKTVQVMVSHIDDPTNFYIQQMGETVNYIYSISKDLNATYFQPPSSDYPTINKAVYSPKIGMACAVQFSTDMQWYRGQITRLPGNKKVEVHYIDYGNTEIVPYTNLRRVARRTLRIPPLATLCSLSDVLPVGGHWSSKATDFFKKLATSGTVFSMYINSVVEGKLSVNLYESTDEMDVNLNGLLVEKGYALSSGPSSKTVEFVKPSDVLSNAAKELLTKPKAKKMKKKVVTPIPSECDQLEDATPVMQEVKPVDPYKLEVKLLKAEDPETIYVAVKYHLPHIENMFDEMRSVYEGSDHEEVAWQVGMNCACLQPGEETRTWYRGVIKEILKPDTALVFLTDKVEVVEVKFSNLRSLRSNFENVPLPIKCRLTGIIPAGGTNKWSKSASEFVQNFVKRHNKSTYISKKGEIEDMLLPVDVYVCETYTPGPLDPTVETWYTLSEKLIEAGLALPKRGDPKLEPSIMSEVMHELGTTYNQDWKKPDEDVTSTPVLQSSDMEQEVKEESKFMKQGVKKCEEETLALKWLPPTPIDMDSFQALPTNVDDQGFIYFHDYIYSVPKVKELQAALQKEFQGSKTRPEDVYWHPGQLCIAQYHLDGHWYRAQFLRYADDDKGIVMFVDYGNVETCDLVTQLRKCTFCVDLPMLAYKCFLYNIKPVGVKWTTEALDMLHKLIVDNRCKITVQSNPELGKPMMVSIVRCDGLDPAQILVDHGFAMYKKVEMTEDGKLPVGAEEPVDKSPEVLLALAGHSTSPEEPLVCSSPTENVEVQYVLDEKNVVDNLLPVTFPDKTDEAAQVINDTDGSTIESQSDDNEKQDDESSGDQVKLWYDIIAQDEKYEAMQPKPSTSYDGTDLNFTYETLPDNDVFEVTVLGVESCNTVMIFCHKATSEEEEEGNIKYEELLKRLQVEAPQQPQLHNPVPGNLCVACYSEDATWYRAKVVEVDFEEETMVVQYVDYANYETVPFERVVVIKPEWVLLPAQAQPCHLWRIVCPDHVSELVVKTNLEGALIQRRVVAEVKERTPVLSAVLYNLQHTELAYDTLIETQMLLMLE